MAQGMNGAWLALGVASAVAAAGAALGRKGSSNRSASSLTDEQLELLLSPTTPAQQQRLMAQGVDVDWFLDHQGQLLEQATKRREGLVSKYLPRAGRTGADWSVSAWSVDNDNPRQGYRGERFVLLDDDREWLLVRRFSDEDGNDEIEPLQYFRSFNDLKKWLEKNAQQRGSRATKSWSGMTRAESAG